MDATRIIAIRHGETAWNVDSRLQGHLDIPLNDVGLWQARQAALALADEPIDAIYSSDLQRAWVTARAIAETTQAPLTAHQGLRERSFGVLQGHTFEELEAKEPEQAYRWRKRDPAFAPEGGESLIALRERINQRRPQFSALIDPVARASPMLEKESARSCIEESCAILPRVFPNSSTLLLYSSQGLSFSTPSCNPCT